MAHASEGGDDPDYDEMITARQNAIIHSELLDGSYRLPFVVHDCNGVVHSPGESEHARLLPGGSPDHVFRELNITGALLSPHGGMRSVQAVRDLYNTLALENRSANNLGGQGPNNGVYCFTRPRPSLTALNMTCGPGNFQAHPNFIRMNDVTTVDGRRIGLRIDNTTEYKAATPAMNDFNGFNLRRSRSFGDPHVGLPALRRTGW
jgi:hypothetical protein